MAQTFRSDYFNARIFPHIKAIMDTIPARRERIARVWWQLREFIFRARVGLGGVFQSPTGMDDRDSADLPGEFRADAGANHVDLDGPDLPARISFRTSGMRDEFRKGVLKKRLRHILGEVFTMHLGAIAWYPSAAPFLAEHCQSFFEQNKEQLSRAQLKELRGISRALADMVARHKDTIAIDAKQKFVDWADSFSKEEERRIKAAIKSQLTSHPGSAGPYAKPAQSGQLPSDSQSAESEEIGTSKLLVISVVLAFALGMAVHALYPQLKAYLPRSSCSDGTPYDACSASKPFFCVDGKLIETAQLCGCPEGYAVSGTSCEKIPTCIDGTPYGRCSEKPGRICKNGVLYDDASCSAAG